MKSKIEDADIQISRRGFLKASVAILASVSGLVLGLPLIGSLIGSSFRMNKSHFTKVGKVESLPFDSPTKLNFADQNADAYIRETTLRSAWAIKKSASDVTVLSIICPHLGCRTSWDNTSDHFTCPCHGSVFSKDGNVLSGPSPRALDTLPSKVDNGDLYVEWEQFKIGVPQKEAV